MSCPGCGRANRAGARFCGGCGRPLAPRCCVRDRGRARRAVLDACGASFVARPADTAAGHEFVIGVPNANTTRVFATIGFQLVGWDLTARPSHRPRPAALRGPRLRPVLSALRCPRAPRDRPGTRSSSSPTRTTSACSRPAWRERSRRAGACIASSAWPTRVATRITTPRAWRLSSSHAAGGSCTAPGRCPPTMAIISRGSCTAWRRRSRAARLFHFPYERFRGGVEAFLDGAEASGQ
jgi:hypothetical protein